MYDYITHTIHNTKSLGEAVVSPPRFQCFPSASFKVLAMRRPLLHRDGNEGSKQTLWKW